ncbi:toll/interleukin-1 receptor domain-containing protein [Pseudomonas syringae]|uniref:toll/interleukin-1 receptor domain-containing protein n=1 Tax=Pseudomonas syringae TaxID=317 RepID=UPI001BCFA598|nr:toll/interleukin-1 receptor domain-containing protein [Pseudomonas syringae]MBS7440297.1 toll/interleukin-1 receptor domain-containing protein [Pseudomonas syringae]
MKIFLSHTSKDKPNVRAVANYLEDAGYSVWLDEWEMTPGDSLIKKISEGVESSDKLVVFLSPESIISPWVERELNGGLIMEIAEEKGLGSKFVIPVLLEICKVPFFLREKIYANFANKDFQEACSELVSGITGIPRARSMEPYSNAVVKKYPAVERSDGLIEVVLEFTTNLSPISGASVQVVTSGYSDAYDRLGAAGNPVHPDVIHATFTGPRKISDGRIFQRMFTTPELKKGVSYFIHFVTENSLDITSISFSDGYGNSI